MADLLFATGVACVLVALGLTVNYPKPRDFEAIYARHVVLQAKRRLQGRLDKADDAEYQSLCKVVLPAEWALRLLKGGLALLLVAAIY